MNDTVSTRSRSNGASTERRPLVGYGLLAGIVAPALFAVVVTINGLMYEGYSHVSQPISALGETGAETQVVQQTLFFVVGLLILGFAFAVKRTLQPSRRTTIAALLIGYFAISSGIGNSVFPCDVGCAGSTTVGFLHNLTGALGFAAAVAAMLTLAKRFPVGGDRGPYQRYSLVLGIIGALGFASFIFLRATGSDVELDGLAQRVFVGAWLLWIEITAVRLFRAA